MAKAEANGNASHEQQILDYSKACVQPAYDYFYLKFNNDLKPVLDAFKAASLYFRVFILFLSVLINTLPSAPNL